jgi:transglutaminase-like putative cysteine protease
MTWFRQPSTRRPVEDPQALAYLYGFGLLAAAPQVFHQPWWAMTALVGAMWWRYARERRGWSRVHRVVLLALGALVIALVLREFRSLFGRDAGFALLLSLTGLKLLEMETERDYRVVALLFFLVTAGGFLYSQTPAVAVWALAAVTAGIALLVRLTRPGPFRPTLRLAGTLVLRAIPLMLVVYFLFPRVQGTLWGVPLPGEIGRIGLDDHMQPGSIGALLESDETAFRASFAGRIPTPPERYWRALVLWRTDGRGFARGDSALPEERFTALGEPLSYDILLEASNKPYLPTLDWPVTRPDEARVRAGITFERNEEIKDRYSYRVVSHTRQRVTALPAAQREAALQLPSDLSPRVRDFARALRSRGDTRTTARAALAHFRTENFVYTLAPPLLGPDPVDEFLFVTRRGYCEHYAAAFVTLMRAAGVPARVVVGYLGGEYNAAGGYFIVRQSDAHAWAEIWNEGEGWVRIDPTAAVAPERVELGIEALRRLAAQGLDARGVGADTLAGLLRRGLFERAWLHTRLYWDMVNVSWYRWVMDYTPERQHRLFEALGFGLTSGGLVTAALVLSALILIAYALWLRRRPPPPDPAQRLYLKLCRKLARAGLERAPHEGPHAFAARVARERPDLADALNDITVLYATLRYAAPALDRALLAQFKHKTASLRV